MKFCTSTYITDPWWRNRGVSKRFLWYSSYLKSKSHLPGCWAMQHLKNSIQITARYFFHKYFGQSWWKKNRSHLGSCNNISPSRVHSLWSTVCLVSSTFRLNGSTVSFNGHSDHLEYHTFYSLSIRIEKKWASWSRLGEDTKKEKKRALCPSRFLLHYYSQGFPASVATLWRWWLACITLLVLMNFAESFENIFYGIHTS